MLEQIDAPLKAYRERAANNPVPFLIPAGVVESAHGIREGLAAAAAGQCFHPDVSEYQSPYTAAYPYPVASFRFHSGYRVDNNAAANCAALNALISAGRVRVVIAYAVFIPGKLQTVLAGLHQIFGASCPTDRLVLMIDMESSSNGFAGPGNHSAEANTWAQAFADYTGTSANWARSIGYANAGDWASNWPQRDARLKRYTAGYNAKDPSPYAWQYAGGNPAYPVPAGYPRTVAPWSSQYIDMNVINKPIDQVEADFGIGGNVSGPTDASIQQDVVLGDNAALLPSIQEGVANTRTLLANVASLDTKVSTALSSGGVTIDYPALAAALAATPGFAAAIAAGVQDGLDGMDVTSTVITSFSKGPSA